MALNIANLEKNIFRQKSHYHLRVITLICSSFNPFRHIIQFYQDVLMVGRKIKWTIEINSPQIKQFNLQYIGHGHLILFRNVANSLTSITHTHLLSSILIHGKPVKTRLPYFCNYLGATKWQWSRISSILSQGTHILIIPSAQCLQSSGSFKNNASHPTKFFSSDDSSNQREQWHSLNSSPNQHTRG